MFRIITLCILTIGLSFFRSEPQTKEHKIQIALVIDVSSSMNGLINQTKRQIWKTINKLTKAEKKGDNVTIEFAIGSYGSINFPENGHFFMHAPLSSDLDLISEKIFDLRIGGREEYCGYALKNCLDSLQWSDNKDDLKVIFIAGNESFNSGEIDYSIPCKKASKNHIFINTIYCGDELEGVENFWADGAKRGKGIFMTIDQESTLAITETLWDKKIINYNEKLNSTYIPYGDLGLKHLERQTKQDENAFSLGNAFLRDRIMFKVSDYYKNSNWDLVDAFKEDNEIIKNIRQTDFPQNLRTMSIDKKRKYLQLKLKERNLYKELALIYCKKAEEILENTRAETSMNLTLDNQIIDTIIEQGKLKNFEFK